MNEYRFYNAAAGSSISGNGWALNGPDTHADNWKASAILAALEGADSAAITFATQKGSGSYAMLTIAKQDEEGNISYTDFGTTFSSEYVTSRATVKGLTLNSALISKAYGYQASSLSLNDVKDTTHNVAAANIPEPATATLSLLALAGLAARRRRH